MKAIKFLADNWAVIAPFVLLIISEAVALNPKLQSNSIVQIIINLFKRKPL